MSANPTRCRAALATSILYLGLWIGLQLMMQYDQTNVVLTKRGRRMPWPTDANINDTDDGGCLDVERPRTVDVRRRHEHWQVQADGDDDELVLYSAFYDDRPIVGRLPWLRILAIRRITPQADQKMFCYVWYKSIDSPYVVEAGDRLAGRKHNISAGSMFYDQRLISCELPDATVPEFVSVGSRRVCANLTTLLPVQRPHRPEDGRWQHEFSVCVTVHYGSIAPEVIVEWIEAHALFGVTKFGIYDGNFTDQRTVDAFEHYARRGLVDFRKLPPGVENDLSVEAVKLSSHAALNDCMMRNMYSSRFVLVIDLDEVLVPRMHGNYSSMLAHLNRHLGLNESYHTYSFRNAYFFTYWPQDVTQPAYLRTMRFRHRAPPSEYMFGVKSFVDPRRCLSVFNHYCWIRFPDVDGYRGLRTSVDVTPTVCTNHHYRDSCPFNSTVCAKYDRSMYRDDVTLGHRPILEERVSSVLRLLGSA